MTLRNDYSILGSVKNACHPGCIKAFATIAGCVALLILLVAGSLLFMARPPQWYRADCPKYVDEYFTAERNRQLTELAARLLASPNGSATENETRQDLNTKHGLNVMKVDREKQYVQLGYLQLRRWHLYFYRADEKLLSQTLGHKSIRKLDNNWSYTRW